MFNLCPSGDFTCPYWNKGWCALEHPENECDDFAALCGDDEEEDE